MPPLRCRATARSVGKRGTPEAAVGVNQLTAFPPAPRGWVRRTLTHREDVPRQISHSSNCASNAARRVGHNTPISRKYRI